MKPRLARSWRGRDGRAPPLKFGRAGSDRQHRGEFAGGADGRRRGVNAFFRCFAGDGPCRARPGRRGPRPPEL